MRVDRGVDRGGKQVSPRCPRGAAATTFSGLLQAACHLAAEPFEDAIGRNVPDQGHSSFSIVRASTGNSSGIYVRATPMRLSAIP
jgi:hypothetical protein